MQRIKWGQARIEFIAVLPDIKQFLQSGYCKKYIFEYLREKNKITMSWWTFYRWLCKEFSKRSNSNEILSSTKNTIASYPKKELPMHAGNLPAVSNSRPPQIIEQEEETGFGEKQYDNEDLF